MTLRDIYPRHSQREKHIRIRKSLRVYERQTVITLQDPLSVWLTNIWIAADIRVTCGH